MLKYNPIRETYWNKLYVNVLFRSKRRWKRKI